MAYTKEEVEELQKLDRLVDKFSVEMKKKIFAKFDAGWRGGWDDRANKERMKLKILGNASKGDMVDVANYAAFIWNM